MGVTLEPADDWELSGYVAPLGFAGLRSFHSAEFPVRLSMVGLA